MMIGSLAECGMRLSGGDQLQPIEVKKHQANTPVNPSSTTVKPVAFLVLGKIPSLRTTRT